MGKDIMVFPGEWFYQAGVQYDRLVSTLLPPLQNVPQARAYLEGFVAAYIAIATVETGLRWGLQRINQERLLRPMQIAGLVVEGLMPLAVSAFWPEHAQEVHNRGYYLEGIVGLMVGCAGRTLQNLGGVSNIGAAKAVFNKIKNISGGNLEERMK